MKVEDDKIVEATKEELFRLWLDREMYMLMSFPDYVDRFKRCGCNVKEGDA